MWPNSLDGNHPNFCSNNDINVDFFPNRLKEKLNKYWPSISSNNKEFWNHEWKKHGTCTDFTELKNHGKYSSMDDNILYFEKSLDIFENLKIEEFFMHKDYFNSFDDLIKVIKNKYSIENFDSLCFYDNRSRKQYLKELRFKFEKNWELSSNNNLKQESNCYKSRPIYIYPERIHRENIAHNNSYRQVLGKIIIFILLLLY